LPNPKCTGEQQMTVITISRQLGSHGEEIAARVAQALDLRLVDAETINEAALKAGVPSVALAELEHEGERGLVNQMLKALRTMPSLRSGAASTTPLEDTGGLSYPGMSGLTIPFSGLFSPTVPPISASLEGYVRMVGLVIRGLAREGNVLVLGRGGQVLLKRHPSALHFQIVAPSTYRVQIVMDRMELDKRTAQSRVRASDRARFDYVRRYHDADWLDPTLYHLTINTSRVSVDTAVDLIIAVRRAMVPPRGQGS
jgi:cytidylate kinase